MARTPLTSARPLMATNQQDFSSRLVSLTTDLQRGILDEHMRILEIHDHRQHNVICNLRQENRRLRQRLFNESEGLCGDCVGKNSQGRGARHRREGEDEGFPDFPEEMLPDLPEAMKNCRPAHSNGESAWAHLLVFPGPATPKALPAWSPKVTQSHHVAFAHSQREIPSHKILLPWEASPHDETKEVSHSNNHHGTNEVRRSDSNHNHNGQDKGVLHNSNSHWSTISKKTSKSSFHLEDFAVWPEWESIEGEEGVDSQGAQVHQSTSEDLMELTRETSYIDDFGGSYERDPWSKFVLSPYSVKVLMWEMMGLPLLLYDLLTIPMEVFNLPPNAMFMQSLSKVVVVYWTLDVIRKMVTGYVARDGTTVMVQHKILAYYMLSHRFLLDLSITLIDWLTVIGFDGEIFAAAGTVRITKVARAYRLLRVLRLVRLRKLHKIMNIMQDVVNSAFLSTMLTITFNLGIVLGITHCSACFWYWIGTTLGDAFKTGKGSWTSEAFKSSDGWHYRYFTSLHWAITQFTPGSMEVQPKNTPERCYAVIVLVFGMVVFSSFVSSVTNAMAHVQSFSAKYRQQFWLFRRYCRQHKVSDGLVLRVNRYINLVLRPQMGTVQFKDVQLFPLLSEPLYIELLTELHVPQLTSHPFFDTLCRTGPFFGMVRKLCCSAVKQEYFSCNDVVFCKGQVSSDMYFVNKGTLRYSYRPAGSKDTDPRKIHPLREREWCCEAGLWTWWAHAGSMCATSECILVLLNSANFRSSCSEYKLDLLLVRRYGQLFVRHLLHLNHQGIVITDVLAENSPLHTPEMQKLIASAAAPKPAHKGRGGLTLDGVASLFPGQIGLNSHSVDSHSNGSHLDSRIPHSFSMQV